MRDADNQRDILDVARSVTRELREKGHIVRCTDNFIPELFVWPKWMYKQYHSSFPWMTLDEIGNRPHLSSAKVICNFDELEVSCGPTEAGPSHEYAYCNPEFPENLYDMIEEILGRPDENEPWDDDHE